MTDPKDIVQTLHLIRAGLASGLLSKEEVVDWADKIIATDEQPDIFFIDLALSSSKNTKELILYFSDYLNLKNLLRRDGTYSDFYINNFSTQRLTLEQTVKALVILKSEAFFTESEESWIYSIDNDFDCAKNNIYGTIESVYQEIDSFLSLYCDDAIDRLEQWRDLNLKPDEDINSRQQDESIAQMTVQTGNKPWWKFW